MEVTMRFVAILLVLLSFGTVSHAQSMSSRLAKIDDAAALNAAVADIGKLSARQAEAMARSMADCWDGLAARGSTDRAFEECARSHRYFVLLTDDEAPLRQMYDSWYVERVVKGTKGNKQRAAPLLVIEQAFSTAIRKRLDALDQEHR
jgi:hypothetical protein